MSNNYSELPIEQKIGQLFFIGIAGEESDADSISLLERIRPGGVCLFARNTKNAAKTRNLLNEIRSGLEFEPFLSLDQEGGLVDRLRRISEPLPSAKDISRSGNPEFAGRLADLTAETVRILGFNMNFAPVVDVTDKDRLGFIMDRQMRTYGNNKEDVYDFTSLYLNRLQAGGVLGCLKHFPGIGAVEYDPHEELPTITLGRDQLFSNDLEPFIRHFDNENVYAVMTGHAVYPNLDLQETDSNGKLLPSSLSQNIVSELLRNELGYDNLALTDDLEMGAIVNNYGMGEAVRMAFTAGSDFILICNERKAIIEGFEAMIAAFETGQLTAERIDPSLERIFRVREHLKPPLEFDERKLEEISSGIRNLKNNI